MTTAEDLRTLSEVFRRVPSETLLEQISRVAQEIDLFFTNERRLPVGQRPYFLAAMALDTRGFAELEERPEEDFKTKTYWPRGLLKIVGRAAYRDMGETIGIDLLSHPDAPANVRVACRIAWEIWRKLDEKHQEGIDVGTIERDFRRRRRPFSRSQYEALVSRLLPWASDSDFHLREDSLTMRLETGLSRERAASTGRARMDNHITVWYGTNRKLSDGGSGYTDERDQLTHLGYCEVFVPKSHKIGSIGSSLFWQLLTGRDARLTVELLQPLDDEAFWRGLRAVFKGVPVEGRAIVFIHGYNVSFEEAALRAAQIGFDLRAQHAMAFFSWPSRGSVVDYIADTAAIEASEIQIADFLTNFAERSGAKHVHLIAHSMGNRGLLRAVNRIVARASAETGKPFRQIILAAPDVDADVFRQLSFAYTMLSERTSLYVSSRDRAVGAARWLYKYDRAGLTPPIVVVPGIDTIEVTNVDVTLMGHGYVAEARAVLEDIHQLIIHGAPPDSRFALRPLQTAFGEAYWTIKA